MRVANEVKLHHASVRHADARMACADLNAEPTDHMKIYISGALMGASDLERVRDLYESFADTCRQGGHEPYLPHSKTDPALASHAEARVVYDTDLEMLNGSDLVVAYLGEPSLGVGAEIAIALHNQTPILALYEDERVVSRFLIGLLERYGRASICSYRTLDEAKIWLLDRLAAQAEPHSESAETEQIT